MPPKRSKLPIPLPEGLIVTDTNKKSWRLGKKLGQGGFGLIYLASPDCDVTVPDDAAYVIKVENFQNGPLFCELKFYQRAAKQDDVKKWIHSHKLDYLGIPKYWGTGETNYNSSSYRFMVVDRLGMDLQKLQSNNSGRLDAKLVMQIAIRMLDVLEYIHEHEYAHADIKAGNILLHTLDASKVYLADYGLSYRYCPNGKHKEYKEDPRKCHNGTIEFTSRDAHKGVAPSRRGDLEILAYCMLHWLSGKLPWDQSLRDPSTVLVSKTKLWDDLPNSVIEWCGPEDGCQALAKFMAEVSSLRYEEEPNYAALKRILLKALDSMGTSLSSSLITSDARSFQKLSAGVRKKNYSKKTAVHLSTNDDSNEYNPYCGTRTLQDASSNSPKTTHAELYSQVPNIRKPMNYSKKTAINLSTNDDDNENDPCCGTRTMQDASSNSRKTTHADMCSERKRNVYVTQNYKVAADNSPGYTNPQNVLKRRPVSSKDPDHHHQYRQDIYKYGFAVPVLLLMIYYVIYVL